MTKAGKIEIFLTEYLPWLERYTADQGGTTTTLTATALTPAPMNDDQEMTTQTTLTTTTAITTTTPVVSTPRSKKRKSPSTSPAESPETSRKAFVDYLTGLVGTSIAQKKLSHAAKSRFDRALLKHQPDGRWLVEIFLDELLQVLAEDGRQLDALVRYREVARFYRESALQAQVEVHEQQQAEVKRRRQERLDESAEHSAIGMLSVHQAPMDMDDTDEPLVERLDQGQADRDEFAVDTNDTPMDQLTWSRSYE